MKLNQLDTSLKSGIEELGLISGRLFVLDRFVNQTKENINNNPTIGNELMGSGLAFWDVTIHKEDSLLYMPSNVYRLTRNNLKDEIDRILSREYLFQISQAYEVLETFLYDNVAELVLLLGSRAKLPDDYRSNKGTFVSIRKALKSLNNRTNNRHLTNIIRENSIPFCQNEKDNPFEINFNTWYEMLSEVRHCTTHRRMRLTSDIKHKLPVLFYDYMGIYKVGNAEYIYIEYEGCSKTLSMIAQYMFLIYKTVTDTCYGKTINFSHIQHILPDLYHT
ncbi:hypothetical protein SAMN05192574_105356 [Mucilaginibacter gossypiicola]|uniref:Uncharacterized protein n=1 Tax=Mucilaginibacter gossypiicola TaxID=551995 RepID=A0A1H8M2R1_9SPHI|nr:hypothetical protein SAMN05192574_105356 [Mucilaginibacter gossypiicola]